MENNRKKFLIFRKKKKKIEQLDQKKAVAGKEVDLGNQWDIIN